MTYNVFGGMLNVALSVWDKTATAADLEWDLNPSSSCCTMEHQGYS